MDQSQLTKIIRIEYFLCYVDYIKIYADRLITRDSGFYRNYFKDLDIHTPK